MENRLRTFSPLSRNPEIVFQDVQIYYEELPQQLNADVQMIGRICATGILKGWAPTQLWFRVFIKQSKVLIGQKCGVLHLVDARAQEKGWERLWCMNCWNSIIIPFYHHYRLYDDHLIYHLPNCLSCTKKFIVWEHDIQLQPSETYLLSEICNDGLQQMVEKLVQK